MVNKNYKWIKNPNIGIKGATYLYKQKSQQPKYFMSNCIQNTLIENPKAGQM